jgi:hypothetical protein
MKTFAELQPGLGSVLAANRPGSRMPHVVIALASYSVGESLLSHYGAHLGARAPLSAGRSHGPPHPRLRDRLPVLRRPDAGGGRVLPQSGRGQTPSRGIPALSHWTTRPCAAWPTSCSTDRN